MHGPRETVFHPSINRPNLLMGGDRELVLGAAMISALFIFALMTWWSILIGVVFWPLTTSMLVQLAKVDPKMRDVATRSLQYKAYYPAKSRLSSRSTGQRRAFQWLASQPEVWPWSSAVSCRSSPNALATR